jgi:hypothetical protein
MDAPPARLGLDDPEPPATHRLERLLAGLTLETLALVDHLDQHPILVRMGTQQDPTSPVKNRVRHQLADE